MPQLAIKNSIQRAPGTQVKGTGYRIDSRASLFTVRAFADGLISAAAHNPEFSIRDFTGDVHFDLSSPDQSALGLRIKSGFFELMNDVTAHDRQAIQRVMNDEVLEVQRYPEISFLSSSVTVRQLCEAMFHAEIMGHLSLHGATVSMSIAAQLVLGDDTLRSTGSFAIRQSDFGLKIASVAGGTLKVQDELRFCFYILARRTPALGEGFLTARAGQGPILH